MLVYMYLNGGTFMKTVKLLSSGILMCLMSHVYSMEEQEITPAYAAQLLAEANAIAIQPVDGISVAEAEAIVTATIMRDEQSVRTVAELRQNLRVNESTIHSLEAQRAEALRAAEEKGKAAEQLLKAYRVMKDQEEAQRTRANALAVQMSKLSR